MSLPSSYAKKVSIEHDIEFIQKEIEALQNMEEKPFQELRNNLKVRLLTLQQRLEKTIELLRLNE